ncbi:MAG: hypothetical protein WBW41_05005 [Verrucomicrobiia bacterium]
MNTNRINLGRTILFICALACIAAVLYAWQYHRDQQKAAVIAAQQRKIEEDATARKEAEAKEQAALKAEQEAASEHANFIAQYENTNFSRTPNVELIAVACAAEDRTMNQAVSTALVSRFKGQNVELTSSFFKPTLVTEGLFDDVIKGSGETFTKLDLAKYLDGLLLARQDVRYSTNADLNNVVTADMHLQVVTLPVSGQIESKAWTLAAKGTGFNPADARMQAEERIVKQIADDATMSLSQIKANH